MGVEAAFGPCSEAAECPKSNACRGIATLSEISLFKTAHLTLLSRPARDRAVYRQMLQQRPVSIVEIGLGDGRRAERMLELLHLLHPAEQVRYVGLDLFESGQPAQLRLKEAHRRLQREGVRVLLVPGTPWDCLARVANTLSAIDLVVVDYLPDDPQMADAWLYIPRMLGTSAEVLAHDEPGPKGTFTPVRASELATQASLRLVRRDSGRTGGERKAA